MTMRLVQMMKHFMRFGLLDVFYTFKTTVNATDGYIRHVDYPEPFYLLNDYYMISNKEKMDIITSHTEISYLRFDF